MPTPSAVRRRFTTATLLSVSALGTILPAMQSQAIEREWQQPAPSLFADAAAWSGGVAPLPTDSALFDLGIANTVQWEILTSILTPSVDRLSVTSGDVNFLNVLPSSRWLLTLNSGSASSLLVTGPSTKLTLSGLEITTPTASIKNGGTLRLQSAVSGELTQVAKLNVLGFSDFDIDGDLFVTGGSQVNGENLSVGDSDIGGLWISGGSSVNNSISRIGRLGIGTVRVSAGSTWTSDYTLNVGIFNKGSLYVTSGSTVSSLYSYVGSNGGTGLVEVEGAGSTWVNTGTLDVGGDGDGKVRILNNGLVTVGNGTYIWDGGEIELLGGRLEFGSMSAQDFGKITGTSGSLAGNINLSGINAMPTLSPGLSAPIALDTSEVILINNGVLYGSGNSLTALDNTATGEIEVITGERMRFAHHGSNDGQVSLLGGQVQFTGDFANNADGLVMGNGTLRADAGTTNAGTMAFSATTNVVGDVTNNAGGLISTSGGTTTFFDDVVNNGEIRTNAGSFSVYFGSYSGLGDTGTGTVILEGDLKPGFSPGVMSFGGNLAYGETASLVIELAGTAPGTAYDQINVAQTVSLNGTLDVVFLDDFSAAFGDRFTIVEAGNIVGSFDSVNLAALEGDLYWEVEQSSTTFSVTAVPEPTSLAMLGLAGMLLTRRRRRQL